MPLRVSDEDIKYAENTLFGRFGVFDDERISFIKCDVTCDLQAVPGSGKTTALLAKLLILERKLPLENGQAILVISHTNAAMDEIKEKIGPLCPKLFSYPNFIGTIQSFVDQFLAIPFYKSLTRKKPVRIDDELYTEYMTAFQGKYFKGFSRNDNKVIYSFLMANKDLLPKYRFKKGINGELILTTTYLSKELTIKKPRRSKIYVDWTDAEKEKIKNWLIEYKKSSWRKGFLCFDDAYFFASEYLFRFPIIKNLLQLRFKYVFVDEMQDMASHQYKLLEDVFWAEGNSKSVYQRIGDSNQAIYNEGLNENMWQHRDLVLTLSGSHRLPPLIAKVVESFSLTHIPIIGKGKCISGNDIAIKPKLIVYCDKSKEKVIPIFCKIISNMQELSLIPKNPKYPFKAVCWTTGEPNVNEIKLKSYFPPFSKEEQKLKVTYSCLESYLHLYDKNTRTLASIRKNILNAFLRVLRLEQIIDTDGRVFTKSKLLTHLAKKHPDKNEQLKLNLYKWCINIKQNETSTVLIELKDYIRTLLSMFGKTVENSQCFLDGAYIPSVKKDVDSSECINLYSHEGINIEIATVHSCKGQTHTATLYMESFYERGGGGHYESERLKDPLKGTILPSNAHKIQKQSAKMVYVGFSRPTHLLCFAVHKERFESSLHDINKEVWDVEFIN